ncbi:MAG TPA: hypothetical protein VM008_09685 [Phycisphaerae bacterium]|nr:hypothetical protein [Phycisphaerae bacterium]
MSKNESGKLKYVVEKVIRELADGGDLQRVMESHAMSPIKAMQLMQSKRGRDVLKARRRLAKIHRELLASRFSAFAVQRICGVLKQEEKPELWLKAAAEILDAVKGEKRSARKGVAEKEEEGVLFSREEIRRVMALMELGMAAEKERERMTNDK